MLPFIGIEANAKLIFIIHHLQKLSGRNQLYTATLPHNHGSKNYWRDESDSLLYHLNITSL